MITHTNGLQFEAYKNEELLGSRVWFSVGGGTLIEGSTADLQKLIPTNTPQDQIEKL